MKLIDLLLLATLTAAAQPTAQDHPTTDAQKIADALRAGPAFITKDATILDWPTAPDGPYRLLRKGTNEWTCLPGVPGYSHDEPGCFDPTFMQWIKDSLAGRQPHIETVGIAYMYVGAWVPNKSGSSDAQTGISRDPCEAIIPSPIMILFIRATGKFPSLLTVIIVRSGTVAFSVAASGPFPFPSFPWHGAQ